MSTLQSCNLLIIPDLFGDILDYFSPEIYPTDAQALLALAQTCRAFLEPSLDRLWKKLYSLKPLICCYTRQEDVQDVVTPYSPSLSYYLIRLGQVPLTSSQLSTINRYSRRIWELTVFDSASVRFLQCISMQTSCLFPNLKVLRWNSPYVSGIPIIYIQRLLSPTLVSLEVSLEQGDVTTLLSFLDSCPVLCRKLRSIKLRFLAETLSETTTQALSQAICRQEILEIFVLYAAIDEIALKHLSTMSTLKALSVTLSERSRLRQVTFLPTDPIFCSAECLEFSVWDLELVTMLLRPHDQIFHTFRLHHHGRQTSEAVLSFLNVLAPRSRTSPLQEVTLSFWDASHPIPADQMVFEAIRYCLSYKTLQALMVLGSLRELIIEWSDQVSLDDDELADLAHSWPSLQVFYIYCGRGGYTPFLTKYATLRGLVRLIHSCPELHTVGLPLDARQVPVIDEADARKTHFACLVVPESPIGEVLPVAEFLFKCLPCVTALDARFQRPPGTDVSQIIAYERAWQQVERHLEELHDPSFDSAGSDSEGSDD